MAPHSLWRHIKVCKARNVGSESEVPAETSGEVDGLHKKQRVMGVKLGQALLSSAVVDMDEDILTYLFNRMAADCFREVVMGDSLIRKEACLRMMSLGRKEDQKLSDINRVSAAVRNLTKIVYFARENKSSVTMNELIQPQHFDLVVKIARQLSTEKRSQL